VDLVVIPESGLDADPRQDAFLTGELASLAVRLDTAVLANASVEVEGGRRLENTNFFYGPDGELEGTYVKRHLVPYGEYVPGRRWLGFVDELEQIPRDHVGGDRRAIFDVAGIRVGNLICFESAFTELSRGDVRAGAELLVVSTNNRSFRRSANAAQHVAIGQMRAVETGRSVVHAGVSGRSAVIDPHGRVLAAAGLFERTVLQRSVEARRGSTPYMVLGDWILWLSGALLVGTLLRRRFAAAEDHS
jgi:apolipoprotein N-acyltransferase